MINSLWISKTGMQAQQTQLDVISNNLANVSTNGFKRANAVFEDLMYQNLRQVGASSTEQNELPTGLQIGLGVRTVATSRSFAQGSLQQSGNNLDLAINGNGFLQVTMPDGTIGYTRDGSLQLDAQGRLVTSSGLPAGRRHHHPGRSAEHHRRPATAWSRSSCRAAPQPSAVGNIELANFINPAGLEPAGKTCTPRAVASGNPVNGAPGTAGLGTVMQGFVETSNVNVVQELVTMIQTQRAYEMNSKAIQTSRPDAAAAGSVVTPPRRACSASPPRGQRWRPGEAGSAAFWVSGTCAGLGLLAVFWFRSERTVMTTCILRVSFLVALGVWLTGCASLQNTPEVDVVPVAAGAVMRRRRRWLLCRVAGFFRR